MISIKLPTIRSIARRLLLIQLVVLAVVLPRAANHQVAAVQSNTKGGGGGFNYEIEKRVHERVSELMSVPVTMLGLVEQYSKADIFEPPFLRPHQKQDIFRLLWTVSKEFNIDLYYGQEDGLFLGIIKGSGTHLDGRGTNGYEIGESFDDDGGLTTPIPSEEDEYFKRLYYDKCVDRENGIAQNCTLEPQEVYLECVDHCQPSPCPSSPAATTSTVAVASSSENYETIEIVNATEQTIIYCPQYELRNQTYPMGYIPRYYYCLNDGGNFIENDPPNSVASPSHMANGVCTHTDGATLVDGRTATKQTYTDADRRNYLFLREYDYPSAASAELAAHLLYTDDPVAIGDDQKSDQIFVGGHQSRRYEPRLRPWYIGTREVQNAFWTKPYPFATNNDMGISYGKPLYYTDPKTGHKVFRGVICVDYDLEKISKFLRDVFLEVLSEVEEEAAGDVIDSSDSSATDADSKANSKSSSSTGATVLVVEDVAPHYIIGSSTGSKATKKVRNDDENIDCDAELLYSASFDCKTVRSTPRDANTILDRVMALAYEAQEIAGFPKKLVVSKAPATIRKNITTDGSDNTTDTNDDTETMPEYYVSQSLIYEQSEGENLRWRIIVALPVGVSANDSLFYGDPMFFVVLAVGLVGCFTCSVLFYYYFSKRQKSEIQMSDWRFTSAFILGCALFNLTSLTYLGPANDGTCMLRMWASHLVFVLVLAPLLVKVWRIWQLVGSADRAVRLSITNYKAMLYTMPPILLQVLILTVFTIFDPSKQYTYVDVDGSSSYQHSICQKNSPAFTITQIVFEGSMVLYGCILAFKTRNLDSTLGEAKQLLFAMYNVALVAVIVALMGSLLQIDQKSVYVIMSAGIFWATVFSSCAFVLPRILQLHRNDRRRSSTRNRGSFARGASYYGGFAGESGSLSGSNHFSNHGSGALTRSIRKFPGAPTYQGGSMFNEPGSEVPKTSSASDEFHRRPPAEAEEMNPDSAHTANTFASGTMSKTIGNDLCPSDIDHTESAGGDDDDGGGSLHDSDLELELDVGHDREQPVKEGDRKEQQQHRNTSFTKQSISISECEVLDALATSGDVESDGRNSFIVHEATIVFGDADDSQDQQASNHGS